LCIPTNHADILSACCLSSRRKRSFRSPLASHSARETAATVPTPATHVETLPHCTALIVPSWSTAWAVRQVVEWTEVRRGPPPKERAATALRRTQQTSALPFRYWACPRPWRGPCGDGAAPIGVHSCQEGKGYTSGGFAWCRGLGLAVPERWHHGEWDACGDGGAWRTRMHPRVSRYHQLARLTRFRGAKRGANGDRHWATQGDVWRRCLQLAGSSGDAGQRPATVRLRLTCEESLVRTQLRPPGQ